jgi:hypothetical protein
MMEAVSESIESEMELRQKDMAINKFFSQVGFFKSMKGVQETHLLKERNKPNEQNIDKEINKLNGILSDEDKLLLKGLAKNPHKRINELIDIGNKENISSLADSI